MIGKVFRAHTFRHSFRRHCAYSPPKPRASAECKAGAATAAATATATHVAIKVMNKARCVATGRVGCHSSLVHFSAQSESFFGRGTRTPLTD
jgi:hypothetical protein